MKLKNFIELAKNQIQASLDEKDSYLSARLLVSQTLKQDLAYLIRHQDAILDVAELKKLNSNLARLLNKEPLAYIVSQSKFYDLELRTTPAVLIPRPETEELVDIAFNLTFKFNKDENSAVKIIDLGTGSGAIAITLAKLLEQAAVKFDMFASDLYENSLAIARHNANAHKVRIEFLLSDWWQHINEDQFDLIIANPPYIDKHDFNLKNLTHEPMHALIAANHGLRDLELLIQSSHPKLNDKGYLILEHGFEQSQALTKYFVANKYKNIQTYKDLSNKYRFSIGSKN